MDHNLDDSLNLDSAMGVDFEPPGDAVVSEGDISLHADPHEANIPMEFEPIEEQPMLMDAENEQIIGYSDDQFNLQEYGVHQDDETGANTTVVSSELPMSESDTMLDIQFDPQSFTTTTAPIKIEPQVQQPKIIAVKAAIPSRVTTGKKEPFVVHAMPRQVAIAPKPLAKPLGLKPLSLATARAPTLVKKVSIAGVTGAAQGKTVLAQIGKQLVMVPGTNQKIKLVAAPSGVSNIQYIRANQNDQAQLIPTKTISGTKPMLTKFIIQGGQSSEASSQPAVITRLVQAAPQARFVTMTQKTVPISMPNKVLVTSPSKQTVRITKKQHIVEIKSPTTAKFIPTTQTAGTKKVVITATPTQNVILKTTAPPKNPQISKDGNITIQGQRTQLHQINVPGKGIQYIRLVTSGAAPRPRPAPAAQPKAVMLTDAKGNVLQMTTDKMQGGQPPPLVIAGSTATFNKLTARPHQKLVRIAPVGSKPALAATSSGRPLQSLLAPLSPPAPAPVAGPAPGPGPGPGPAPVEDEEAADCKAALQELLRGPSPDRPEVEIELERQRSEGESRSNSPDPAAEASSESIEPLIVIPDYLKPKEIVPIDYPTEDGAKRFNNFEAQAFNYQQPPTPQPSEGELVSTELGMRPRKACNCTKSQCLKLYCDCFANGEFCHRCNCNNCHNNLENEELRQKAIRGCLDRNPNAFRPKIGKAKSGGPEIVRRHNKGCNCKRSGCLKNYCECYEAKIACTAMCKCVGCRNVEESLSRRRDRARDSVFRPQALPHINFMTTEVIEAVCQCLIAAAAEPVDCAPSPDPVRDVIDEFSRCLQDIINAAHHSAPMLDESRA